MRQALTPLIVNEFNVPIMITHDMEKDFGFYISEKNLITLFGTTIYFTMINDNVLLNDKDYWVKCDLESANLLKGFPDMLCHQQNHRMKLHV